MIHLKNIFTFISIPIIMASFSQCGSAQSMSFQKEAPVVINAKEVYCQKWVAGVKGGGAGINLIIPVDISAKRLLDSAYFRGMKVKLERNPKSKEILYIARFNDGTNSSVPDLVLNADPQKEYGNAMPKPQNKTPFQLNDDERALSYVENGITKYFKITGIKERPMINYPSANQRDQGL